MTYKLLGSTRRVLRNDKDKGKQRQCRTALLRESLTPSIHMSRLLSVRNGVKIYYLQSHTKATSRSYSLFVRKLSYYLLKTM